MSAWIIALMASVGITTWAYSKLQQRTGYGNPRDAFIGAVTTGIIAFIVLYMLAKTLIPSS